EAPANESAIASQAEDLLNSVLWDVVRDEQGQVVRQISGNDPATGSALIGQEVAFRTTADNGVVVTKTFRLWQNADGFEVDLKFESPSEERTVSYNLLGPHGIPVEGEWYTGTFRDVFFGTLNRGAIDIATYSAYDVAKAKDKRYDSMTLPLRFAGV